MISIVDVETSYQKTEHGGKDPLPFNPKNILVSVGINDEYYFTNHTQRVDEGCYYKIQAALDKTTLLVGVTPIEFGFTEPIECHYNTYDHKPICNTDTPKTVYVNIFTDSSLTEPLTSEAIGTTMV